MIFNRFNFTVTFLVLLIAFTGTGVLWVWSSPEFKVAKFSFLVFWLLEIIILLHYVNKTNRRLQQFLERINYSDLLRNDSNDSQSFKSLNLTYNEIIRYMKMAKLERENTGEYLRSIVSFVPVGILTLKPDGEVELVNQSCLDLLGISELKHISDLEKLEQGLTEKFLKIKKEQEIIPVKSLYFSGRVLVRMHEQRIGDSFLKLFSLQSIQEELEREEASAWKKIFRVLTHEIMNSVGPIRSLTNSVLQMFQNEGKAVAAKELEDEDVEIAVSGLQSIDNRNKGLSRFVSDFKSMNRIPEADMKKRSLVLFMEELKPVLQEMFTGIDFEMESSKLSKDVFLSFDDKQLAQVLINVLKNAREALTGESDPRVRLKLEQSPTHIYIIIEDNGPGILPELRDQIFIPFFTTKENGSGIGLALSRQMIWNMHAKMYEEARDKGARFVIRFDLG